jgi:hypothetical protein
MITMLHIFSFLSFLLDWTGFGFIVLLFVILFTSFNIPKLRNTDLALIVLGGPFVWGIRILQWIRDHG